MKNNNEIIGILGGTFDPIHYGHLRMAQELLESFSLNAIRFIPCCIPVHRDRPYASADDRLQMLKMAIDKENKFIADDREIKRNEPSYTIDTLISLRDEMPNTIFCLIIGIDAFLHYHTWQKPHQILELANIIVAHRPSYELPQEGKIIEFLKKYYSEDVGLIKNKKSGVIIFQSITALDISGEMIRNEIRNNKSARFLLPDVVYEYIKTNKLYLSK